MWSAGMSSLCLEPLQFAGNLFAKTERNKSRAFVARHLIAVRVTRVNQIPVVSYLVAYIRRVIRD